VGQILDPGTGKPLSQTAGVVDPRTGLSQLHTTMIRLVRQWTSTPAIVDAIVRHAMTIPAFIEFKMKAHRPHLQSGLTERELAGHVIVLLKSPDVRMAIKRSLGTKTAQLQRFRDQLVLTYYNDETEQLANPNAKKG
jgi:hypothetical protein